MARLTNGGIVGKAVTPPSLATANGKWNAQDQHIFNQLGLWPPKDPLILDGAVLYFDAGSPLSYSGSGTSWNDLSTSARNLTLFNSPAFVSSGSSSYFTFNGSSQSARSDNMAGIVSGLSDATASIWYRPLSQDDNAMVWDFCSATDTQVRDNFSMRQNWGGGPTAAYTVNTAGQFTAVAVRSEAGFYNTWRNYTAVRRGNVYYTYINGVPTGNQENITGTIRTTSRLILGQDNVNTNFLHGDYAHFMVYNRGLSDAEVLENFEVLRGRYGI